MIEHDRAAQSHFALGVEGETKIYIGLSNYAPAFEDSSGNLENGVSSIYIAH